MRMLIALSLIPLALISGCAPRRSAADVRYTAGSALPGLHAIGQGGDFALYYDDNRKPEIPIRLNAGEAIGFERAPDGRIEAVAGAFRMHLAGDPASAYWRRLDTRAVERHPERDDSHE